jgi:hypothetical protein
MGLEYRQGREFVVSSKSSRPEMGSTQLLTQRVRGVKLPEMRLTTHFHKVPRQERLESYLYSPLYAFTACIGTILGGRDSAGSVATLYGLDGLGFETR